MDKETAIRIISKPGPCKHPSYRIFYERSNGYPSCQCDTCGRIYRHGMHPDVEKYEKEYIKEFNEALEYLRSLPEPSAPVDDEYEQVYSAWRDENKKWHESYVELTNSGISIYINGKKEWILVVDNEAELPEGFYFANNIEKMMCLARRKE